MWEQLAHPWWVFVVLGVCAGLLSGSLGIGGGVVLVPTLALILGFGQKSAQGMSLAIMFPMVLVGAIRYWRNADVQMDLVVIGLIVCGSLAGALLGTELAARLPVATLRKIFSIVLVIVAVKMFFGTPRSLKTSTAEEPGQTNASVIDSEAGNEPGK